jgi:hypothetical protein
MHGHTIEMLPGERHWLKTFNCYALALGLVDTPRYQTIVQTHDDSALANSAFVSQLIASGELCAVSESDAPTGCLVVYCADEKPKHAGLVITDEKRVRSKWGPGEIYEHGLWEVPKSYGGRLRFFGPPKPDRILKLLDEYISVK